MSPSVGSIAPTTPGPFDPKHFHSQALRMGRGTAEASLRTAVGRMYYAMFLIVREHPTIQAQMSVLPRGVREGTHEYVIRVLRSLPSHSGTAQKLQELKQLRHIADYELHPASSSRSNIRSRSDWNRNWQDARSIVHNIYPRIKML